MNVVILGSGNVATVLGRKIKMAGHNIVQVRGRNESAVRTLAEELKAVPYFGEEELLPADIYIIAVSDAAIPSAAEKSRFQTGIVVHTAGSVSINVLQSTGRPHGILYPLQSLRKEMDHIPEIPLFIDASNTQTFNTIQTFAQSLSTQVEKANDDKRTRLHLAAVFVSNFTNHLYALGHEFCKENHLPFSFLQPLIEETATRLRHNAPKDLQTGPAARNDQVTIDKHRNMLEKEEFRRVYDVMTESVRNFKF